MSIKAATPAAAANEDSVVNQMPPHLPLPQPPPPQLNLRPMSSTLSTTPTTPTNTTNTTNTASMTPSQRRTQEECQSCIQLLQQVLFSNHSTKSSKLLQQISRIPATATATVVESSDPSSLSPSFTSSSFCMETNHHPQQQQQQQRHPPSPAETTNDSTEHVRLISNGVQVRIPPLSRINDDDTVVKVASNRSAATTTTTTTTDDDFNVLATTTASPSRTTLNSSNTTDHINANDADWIDITCRTCSDFGPEANARAFVMGPTPLSIVICHNRIASLAVTTTTPTHPHQESPTSIPPLQQQWLITISSSLLSITPVGHAINPSINRLPANSCGNTRRVVEN